MFWCGIWVSNTYLWNMSGCFCFILHSSYLYYCTLADFFFTSFSISSVAMLSLHTIEKFFSTLLSY